MSSDESDLTPESIKLDALGIVNNLLPEKSKEKYLKAYDDFHKWKTAKGAKSVSEAETMEAQFLSRRMELVRDIAQPNDNLNCDDNNNYIGTLGTSLTMEPGEMPMYSEI